MKYEYAVERGDTEKAERLLRNKAAERGYEAGDDWRMAHGAPNPDSGVALPNADAVYGADGSIYTPAAGMYYGEGRSYDGKALVAFNKARNNPGAMITVYRAVPSDVQDAKLRNGDWATPTREYASEHGEMYFDGNYRIIKETVPAKYLYVNGDSIHEFGYDNGRVNELYKNTRNNVKLSGVTYVRLQEIKYGFDADGNEYLSNNEIKAAINSMSGLTTKQRAALWQLATGSTSARRNPYDGKVGQQVIDAREKAKENADSGAGMNAMGDDESFQQAFLNQLLGRG